MSVKQSKRCRFNALEANCDQPMRMDRPIAAMRGLTLMGRKGREEREKKKRIRRGREKREEKGWEGK